MFVFFNDTATTEIYTYGHTLSLHDALPIWPPHDLSAAAGTRLRLGPGPGAAHRACRRHGGGGRGHHARLGPDARRRARCPLGALRRKPRRGPTALRSEEHTSELQSLMRISYAVFCLKKKKQQPNKDLNN